MGAVTVPRGCACGAPARRRLAGCGLVIVLLALATGATVAAQDTASHDTALRPSAQQSRFARTVATLQEASPEVRSDFATAALSRLADAYSAEAGLARRDAQGKDVRAWTATVEQYASQIHLLLDDVALGLPVRLTVEGDDALAIGVGDRTVIVSHPRLSQQGVLEQAILKEFCSRQDCEQIEPDQKSLQPIADSAAFIRPVWSFTQHGSQCSHDGITVRFSNAQNTAHARLICEQFLQEVTALLAELAAQRRHAVQIQWEQLALQSVPGRPEHLVQLNGLGDSVLVTAPLLYASPGLLQQLLPWLRQWLEGAPPVAIEIDAARYGWQQP